MNANTKTNTILLGVVGIVALALIGWFLVLSPRMASASEINEQADVVETQNQTLSLELTRLEQQKAAAPKAAAEAQKLLTQIPQEVSLPVIFTAITDAATNAGINPRDVTDLSPSIPVVVGGGESDDGSVSLTDGAGINLAVIKVNITVKGTRNQIQQFLKNLEAIQRSVVVTNVEMTTAGPATEDAGTVTAAISAQLFVLQSQLPDLVKQVEELLAQADGTAPAAPSAPADPTAPANPAPPAESAVPAP